MTQFADIDTLRRIPAVAALPAWRLEAVAEHAELLKVNKGTTFIERGSDDGFTYFLIGGSISLDAGDGQAKVVEVNGEPPPGPIANLRPRIADVRVLQRVQAIRVPDILLNGVECGVTGSGEAPSESPGSRQHAPDDIESRLPFELYRDLRDDASTILPSLPEAAVRIDLAIEKEASNAATVARIVETDPAMAAKLVKTANSALYAGRLPADSCTTAVVRMGTQVTRQLVMSFALKEVFRTRNKALRQRMKDLWEHSSHVAAVCFVLSRETPGLNPEEALLAGLVHDVGTIAVLNYANSYLDLAADPARLEHAISCLRGELGALILRRWDFAPGVFGAARDAEHWLREHDGPADLADLVIVAQVHDRMRRKRLEGLPELDNIPAFARVFGEDVSPAKSLTVLEQAQTLVGVMHSLLRR